MNRSRILIQVNGSLISPAHHRELHHFHSSRNAAAAATAISVHLPQTRVNAIKLLRILADGEIGDHAIVMAKTVLVVDDSVTMVMSLKTTLSLNGFLTESAANGREALDKIEKGLKPDLIVTDVNMPVMGGMELIRSIRTNPSLRFIPILTLTTESDAAKRNQGKLAGATGWVVKPVSGNDLVAVIRKVLPGA